MPSILVDLYAVDPAQAVWGMRENLCKHTTVQRMNAAVVC